MEKTENILIIEDDKLLCEQIKTGLREGGYSVTVINCAGDAFSEIKKKNYNLVLLDLVLPDIEGSVLMGTLHQYSPETSFIIFTGFASISSAIEALKMGAYDYIVKPFDIEHLKMVIRRGLEKQRLTVKNRELIERLERETVKLEIIMDAYNRIGSIFYLDQLADFVTEKALQVAEAEKASLMVIEENTRELVLKGGQGIDKEKLQQLRVKLGDMVSGWVAQEGEALLVEDIDSDPRLRATAKARGKYKTKSFISLPLKNEQRVLGVMNVTDKLASTRVFTEEDLRYLQLLAHQTVIQIENIRLCEKLASLAVTDALTGVFNHRYFQEQLNQEMLRSSRYGDSLSLFIFDIDSFKDYNDNYGHLEGDRVLKQVAGMTRLCTRKVDIVCRYGGDEFVVILPATALRGAISVADKVRDSVARAGIELNEKKKKIKVTISGGVASFAKGMSREELIDAADRMLYKAKTSGGNRVCWQ